MTEKTWPKDTGTLRADLHKGQARYKNIERDGKWDKEAFNTH